MGGALANFAFNWQRRHPSGTRSLIDWCAHTDCYQVAHDIRKHTATAVLPCCRDLILVMEPATILGALLGSYVNKVHDSHGI